MKTLRTIYLAGAVVFLTSSIFQHYSLRGNLFALGLSCGGLWIEMLIERLIESINKKGEGK